MGGHGFDHVVRVHRLAIIIAGNEEFVDKDINYIFGWASIYPLKYFGNVTKGCKDDLRMIKYHEFSVEVPDNTALEIENTCLMRLFKEITTRKVFDCFTPFIKRCGNLMDWNNYGMYTKCISREIMRLDNLKMLNFQWHLNILALSIALLENGIVEKLPLWLMYDVTNNHTLIGSVEKDDKFVYIGCTEKFPDWTSKRPIFHVAGTIEKLPEMLHKSGFVCKYLRVGKCGLMSMSVKSAREYGLHKILFENFIK